VQSINQSMFNATRLKKHAPAMVAAVLMLTAGAAFAQSGSGADNLGNGVCKVVNLLTGKWLFGTAVLSMVAGGVALLFGAELTDLVKRVVTIITVIGAILSFGGILSLAYSAMSSAGC
jgi:type IV secretory pathway VirB2 component (pilin)